MASDYQRTGMVELADRAIEVGRNGGEVLVWSPRDDTLLRFGPEAFGQFRELLDRAAMPGQPEAARPAEADDDPVFAHVAPYPGPDKPCPHDGGKYAPAFRCAACIARDSRVRDEDPR